MFASKMSVQVYMLCFSIRHYSFSNLIEYLFNCRYILPQRLIYDVRSALYIGGKGSQRKLVSPINAQIQQEKRMDFDMVLLCYLL